MSTDTDAPTAQEREQQLAWERRWAPWAAAAAFAGAVAIFLSQVLAPRIPSPPGRRLSTLLTELDRTIEPTLATIVGLAIGYALLGAVVYYLYLATRFRRRQTLPAARVLTVLGAVFASVGLVVFEVIHIGVANEFVSSGPRTEARAKELLQEPAVQVAGGAWNAGLLALAFALVLVAINAMRAGLLSRFMGFFGALVGAVLVLRALPAAPSAWLIALGMLFLGRWPGGGRGPAWETGEATPWPTPVERREQFEAERAAREAGLTREEPEDERNGGPASGDPDTPAGDAPKRPAKRKRKRRR